jgi:hypothetical protein
MRAQPEPKFEDRTPPAKNFEKYKFWKMSFCGMVRPYMLVKESLFTAKYFGGKNVEELCMMFPWWQPDLKWRL